MIKKYSILFFFFLFLFLPIQSFAQISAEREAQLRSELAQVEAEQRETEKVLKDAQGQTVSLERDILILNTKIKAAQLNIKAKNLLIESLGKDINKKIQKIGSLEDRIIRSRESLAQILKKTYEYDQSSITEIALSGQSLSQFFSDLSSFEAIQSSLKDTVDEVKTNKTQTETEKTVLDKRKNAEVDARVEIEQDKKNIEKNETEKKYLLSISKGKEQTYTQILAEKKKRAAEIRAALFSLRDAGAIPFDKALEYANSASQKTGVRPAFLLAILMQESSLGKDTGSCYLTNTETGEGASVRSGNVFKNVMKPSRDVGPFVSLTKELGLDPMKTLVSCPLSIGWGGAMGPAQFIASTWNIFRPRLETLLNKSTPNPWEPKDAFMASSLYLSDLGAGSQTYTSEWNAACKYYSGQKCGSVKGNTAYGNSVIVKARTIQDNINIILGL